jgi:ectoine hydroxylase-related dioxygenase (phytanoyl-CoA dioxygenase family)
LFPRGPHKEETMQKITDDEIRFFDENGYVILRGVLQPDELAHLQAETRRLMDEVLSGGPADRWCLRGPEGVPYYLQYLHSHPNTASERLLAHPTIADLARRMVGEDFVPTFESLVFKLPENGSSVPWHQDATFDRSTGHRIFNVDIYLDESNGDNGGVWVVPGSVHWPKAKIKEFLSLPIFVRPGMVQAHTMPGDVLLHDIMVLHGSDVNRHPSLRRVIYYEFRSARQILGTKSWNEDWIAARLKLFRNALHTRKTQPYASDDEPFDYTLPAGWSVPYTPGEPVEKRIRH